MPSSHTEDNPAAASSAPREGAEEPVQGRRIEITMPQMGVSVAEGTIVEWRKQPGDWIEADEPVCDVTTDKIDVEIPSPASGRLDRILVESGATVAVGTPLAEINAEARPGEAHPDEHNGKRGPPASAERDESAEAPEESGADGDRSRFYSPVVRRIAEKHGIDLAQLSGTGIGGRVRKKDVLAHVEAQEDAREGPPERVLHTESPYRPDEAEAPTPGEAGGEAAPAAPDGAPSPGSPS